MKQEMHQDFYALHHISYHIYSRSHHGENGDAFKMLNPNINDNISNIHYYSIVQCCIGEIGTYFFMFFLRNPTPPPSPPMETPVMDMDMDMDMDVDVEPTVGLTLFFSISL